MSNKRFYLIGGRSFRIFVDFTTNRVSLDEIGTSLEKTYTMKYSRKSLHFRHTFPEMADDADENVEFERYCCMAKEIINNVINNDPATPELAFIREFDEYEEVYEAMREYEEKLKEEEKKKAKAKKPTQWTLDDVILPEKAHAKLTKCINRVNKFDECVEIGCYDFYNTILLTGPNGCVDKDTEFFNGTQWKKISEYDNDNVLIYHKDGKATLEKPKEYIKLPCDEMTLMTSPSGKINQCLSDEHRFIYFTRKTNVPHEMTFAEFKQHYENDAVFGEKYVKTAFDYESEGLDLSDEELRVMVMVIADGYYRRENTNNCVLHFKKENKIERAKQLLENANIEYKIWNKVDSLDISFAAPRKEKVFTSYYYTANKHQMEIILEECLLWDGTVYDNRKIFYTNVKESADYIQFIATSLGHYSGISIYDRIGKQHSVSDYTYKTLEYQVHICKNNKVQILRNENNPKINFENYKTLDGFKYCFKVSTGMLILRRNNRIFVTGNCGKTAIAKNLCNSLDKEYIYQSGAALANKYVGTSAEKVRNLFDDARKNDKIIIIDEFESVTRKRGSTDDNQEYANLLNELLTQLDGFEDNGDMIFIALTNRKDLIDEAILRRFKTQLEIPKPDEKRRIEIFELYINKMKHTKGKIDVKRLAKMTEGVNGSFIRDVVNQAGFRAVDSNRKEICQEDLEFIIREEMEDKFGIKLKTRAPKVYAGIEIDDDDEDDDLEN